MSPLAWLEVETAANVAVARIEGEIDRSNSTELTTTLLGSVENTGLGIVLDLSGTTYLDSAGIDLIFVVARQLQQRRQQLHIVVPAGASIARVLELCDLKSLAEVHPSMEDAVESLEQGGRRAGPD